MQKTWLLVLALALFACTPNAGPNDASDATAEPGAMPIPAGAFRFVPQIESSAKLVDVTISPGGLLAAVSGANGTVRVWDLRSSLLYRTLERAPAAGFVGPETLAFLEPDAIGLIDVTTGERRRVASGQKASWLATAPANVVVGAYSDTSELVVWDVERDAKRWSAPLPGEVDALALAPDGSSVAVAVGSSIHLLGADGTAHVITDPEGKLPERDFRHLAFAKTGDKLLALRIVEATVWDTRKRTLIRRFDRAAAAAFTPDGEELIVTGQMTSFKAGQGAMRRYALTTGEQTGELHGAAEGASAIAIDDSGEYVLSTMERYGYFWAANTRTDDRQILDLSASQGVSALALNADYRLVVAGGDGTYVWDLHSGAVVERPTAEAAYHLAVSPDGRRVVTDHKSQLELRLDENEPTPFDLAGFTRRGADFSPDGKRLLFAGVDRDDPAPLRMFDATTGKEAFRAAVPSGRTSLDWGYFVAGGELLVVSDDAGRVSIHDAERGEVRHELAELERCVDIPVFENALTVAASRQHDVFAIGCDDKVSLWNARTGAQIWERPQASKVTALALLPSGDGVVVGTESGALSIAAAADGSPTRQLQPHRLEVTAVALSPDGRILASGSAEGRVRVDALALEGTPSVTCITHKGDWLMYADDGVFDASRHGDTLGAIAFGPRAYRLDQLSYLLNRPDELLRRMQLGTPEMIAYLAGRHRARLQKIGGDAPAVAQTLQVPTASIEALERRDTRDRELKLKLACSDELTPLASYNVYVDGVAVHGLSGKSISGHRAELEETVTLLPGVNRVEFSCTNQRGAEALRVATSARRSDATKEAVDVYFLGFGVSKYKDARLDLQYAHRDAIALAERLEKTRRGHHFRDVHTQVHTDAEVTSRTIAGAKDFLAKARVEDVVVVFIAGHGVHDRDGRYYFITHDTDVKRLSDTAADFELIEDLLVDIRARRKLLLMDTCQSGEEAETTPAASEKTRSLRVRNVRGLELVATQKPKEPPRVRRSLYRRDRFIENDVRRRSGAIVLSSSRGDQLSYEDDDAKHGLFTKAVIDALDSRGGDGLLTREQLFELVSTAVSRETDGAQTPIIDRDNPLIDLALPKF